MKCDPNLLKSYRLRNFGSTDGQTDRQTHTHDHFQSAFISCISYQQQIKGHDSNIMHIKLWYCIQFVMYVLTSVSSRRLLRQALRYLSPQRTDNPYSRKHSRGAELMQCLRHHRKTPYDKTVCGCTEKMIPHEVTLSLIVTSRRRGGTKVRISVTETSALARS